jgi:L-aminopeptidase/D-esterase-like protein
MKGLTDIPSVRVGHSSDFEALTGCTVMLFDKGAVAGFDVRGGASGSEELGVMDPLHLTPKIHGLVFAGGSAFGLEACSGVRRYLEKRGIGFDTGRAKVPLVPGAILYDLGIGRADVRPTREMGEAAAASATNGPVQEGCVGAGTGATVGKIRGLSCAMKGGIGSYTVKVTGSGKDVLVSALAAVNAIGDVIDPASNQIIAGARLSAESREFLNTAAAMKSGARGGYRPENTTLVAVVTNAALSKLQATKLAQLAQHGMIRAISPVHTMSDGDLVVAASVGDEVAELNSLGSPRPKP